MPALRESQATLVLWTLLIAAATIAGLLVGHETTDPELKRALYTASLTLTFGALLGGLAKLLLEDLDRGRQQRSEYVQFLLTCLADLKAVYDRTERTRVLLPANRSAATLGNEMRELLDARTRLLNVARAIAINNMMAPKTARPLVASVDTMSAYLGALVADISVPYKEISELQRRYEAAMKAYTETAASKPLEAAANVPRNEPWERIRSLPSVQDLLNATGSRGQPASAYDRTFLDALDRASKVLTDELQTRLR